MAEDKLREALEGLLETIEYWQQNGNLVDVSVDLAANVIDARKVLAANTDRADSKGTSAPLRVKMEIVRNEHRGYIHLRVKNGETGENYDFILPEWAVTQSLATSGAPAGEWDGRAALLSVITGHRMIGSDEKNPIEKICECGQRFIGLLAQDLHEKEMQEEAVKRIYAAGRAAAPGSLSEEQVWNAALLEAAKSLCCHCAQGLAVEYVPTAPKVPAHCVGGQLVHCYAWAIHKLFRGPAGAPGERKGA